MTASPAPASESEIASGPTPPKHVAIIMDGNGRWAKARGLARKEGHKEGVKAARKAVEAARELGLTHLTLYSFSTENWRRPAGEVRDLMGLLREFIVDDLPKLNKEGCKVVIIGDRENLSIDLKALVNRAEQETRNNKKFVLQIAFNYGGRDELARAARAAAKAVKAGELAPEDINEQTFSRFLDTSDVPDPDLVIRTSGEKRISNYLLWQAAYAEYVFLDVLWPDFNKEVFAGAIEEYFRRERRYGGVSAG
ncbi:isoprenyl transferase [Hyphococcus sp.]|uniref:isoprenyl transferase n=1 Tax=Hyphococcus sp. TaxID=2038636 RepID=UPI0020812017|nr:MAG: isoprenyl transferase 2 [Marinicaulis sp.]